MCVGGSVSATPSGPCIGVSMTGRERGHLLSIKKGNFIVNSAQSFHNNT